MAEEEKKKRQPKLLTDREISEIEAANPRGFPSSLIIEIFNSRGIPLAEPTFRRYVQLGLLPRCRRVGSRGKHRGSHGIYPVETVRRINSIKRMVSGNLTLEQLRRGSARFDTEIGSLAAAAQRLVKEMKRELGGRTFDPAVGKRLAAELAKCEQDIESLRARLEGVGGGISELPIIWDEEDDP